MPPDFPPIFVPQKDENTQIIRNRGYRVEERRISLDADTPMFMAIGYGFAPAKTPAYPSA